MAARITINLTAKGELEIWLNEEGRDLLVRELQHLSEKSDHFHFGPAEIGEVEVSSLRYRYFFAFSPISPGLPIIGDDFEAVAAFDDFHGTIITGNAP
jgi:hypothetical protein